LGNESFNNILNTGSTSIIPKKITKIEKFEKSELNLLQNKLQKRVSKSPNRIQNTSTNNLNKSINQAVKTSNKSVNKTAKGSKEKMVINPQKLDQINIYLKA